MGRIVIAVSVGLIAWVGLHLYYFFRKEARADMKSYRKAICSWRNLALYAAALAGMIFCYLRAEHYGLAYINCLRNGLVYAWLLIIALIDGKEQLIPRVLTGIGLGAWAVLVGLAVFAGGASLMGILFFSASGLLLGGGLFMICRLLTRGGVGMGDIRMFSVLGLMYGMNYTFSILFFTILLMSVFGVAATVAKKKNMKSMIAMGPFTLVSYLICCFLGV